MKDLLKKLVEAFGPAGNESRIRDVIRKEVEGLVDEVTVDAMGNLIAIRRGQGPRVMIAAHMDEIGVIVTHIDDEGFVRFSNMGGISPFMLIGQRVIFDNGTIGAFGMEKLDDMKDLKLNKMFIDIGAKDGASAKEKVSIGDIGAFHREAHFQGDRVIAKSLDNRAGCAVLVQALKELAGREIPNQVYAVFTVQEELGLRGAKTAAYGINPDVGFAVDVTGTGDTPEAPTMAVKLGEGPTIKVKDRVVLTHPRVRRFMTETAEKNGIPYQLEILEGGGTDTGPIHLTREGVPSGAISVPTRYIHTPSEMADMNDMKNAVKLFVAILEAKLDEAIL
ncbi:MAG: M42 family metallopeptidase [Firmicutes bacterium]|mgnify:FL=1|nr:M42 family metallopeptidase [Bacillota bacterium]HXL04716.1 M42 family metallopeptidase [Bacillota bacterium]